MSEYFFADDMRAEMVVGGYVPLCNYCIPRKFEEESIAIDFKRPVRCFVCLKLASASGAIHHAPVEWARKLIAND